MSFTACHTWNDLTDGCNLNQNTVGLVYEKKTRWDLNEKQIQMKLWTFFFLMLIFLLHLDSHRQIATGQERLALHEKRGDLG